MKEEREERSVYCDYETVVGYIPFTMDGTHYLKAKQQKQQTNKIQHLCLINNYTVIHFIFVVKIFSYTENVRKYFTQI